MNREQLDNVRLAKQAARRHGVPVKLFLRQISQESGFNTRARSKAGALGVAQLMPDTAQGWGVDPHDPAAALDAAAKHMAAYAKQFGSWAHALVAYNAGPGAVGKPLPAETQGYLQAILGHGGFHESADSAGGGKLRIPERGHIKGGTPPQIVPGQTKVDEDQAMVDALLSHAHGGSLLKRYFANVNSGQYTTETAPKVKQGHGPKFVAGGERTVTLPGGKAAKGGTAAFDGKRVASWIKPILEYGRKHGWHGSVNSGFRSRAEQAAIYNSGVRPAAKPGTSNHEGSQYPRGAVDVSDAAQLAAILKKSKYRNILQWAGSKDPVHFSHPHNGGY